MLMQIGFSDARLLVHMHSRRLEVRSRKVTKRLWWLATHTFFQLTTVFSSWHESNYGTLSQ